MDIVVWKRHRTFIQRALFDSFVMSPHREPNVWLSGCLLQSAVLVKLCSFILILNLIVSILLCIYNNFIRLCRSIHNRQYLMFIGPCIIAIVEEWETNLMSLAILFHLLCAQHVSDINISIFRSLRLCWWITTLVVLLNTKQPMKNTTQKRTQWSRKHNI